MYDMLNPGVGNNFLYLILQNISAFIFETPRFSKP